jgi:HAD superfamily hydrolase (TIGR01509 family)
MLTPSTASAPTRRALIFDLDGTLIDSMPWHARAWAALLEEQGVSISPEELLRSTAGKTSAQFIHEQLGASLAEGDIAELIARKERLFRSLYEPHVRALPGTAALLSAARRLGFRLAIATAAPRYNMVFVLERTRLGSHFDALVCADDGLPGKPAPDMFQMAARRLSTEPRHAIVFEDALAGLTAARNAGMFAVAVATTLLPEELAHRPEVLAVVRDFTDFDLALLRRPKGREPGFTVVK